MQYTYQTRGVCSRKITFDLEDDCVKNVRFLGGCSGNTQGVAAPGRWNECGRNGPAPAWHPLWRKGHLLPRSACNCH